MVALVVGSVVGSGLTALPGLVAGSMPAGAHASTPRPAITISSTPSPPLILEYQTPTVGPGQPFDLQLKVGGGGASVPAGQLGLSVSVYACLSSVSGFDQSVSAGTPSSGEISSTTTPLAVSALPTTADGAIDLSMPVVVGTGAAPRSSAPFTIDLIPSGAECRAYPSGGVYPVKVSLTNLASGQSLGGFTTHLVYAGATAGTQKLNFALALPLHASIGPSAAPAQGRLLRHPSAALDPPSPAAVAGIAGVVSAVDRNHVPVTLEASPQTLASMAGSATLRQLATLAATPSVTQLTESPYTPVDATNLVSAGLNGELATQVSRGTEILAGLVTHASPAVTPGGTTPDLGPWITGDGLDTAATTQLVADGYSQLVVPSASITSPPTDGSTAEPFDVSTGRGPMAVIAASADLGARFNGAPGNPVLAAHQLMAELAQIYYEKPNDTAPRATVAVAPTSWADDQKFVDALLAGLSANPIIQPVTTSELFAKVPSVGSCRSGCRLAGAAGPGGLPVPAIRHQRQRVDGFSSAAPTARSVSTELGDLVLAGQSESLRPAQQSAVLRNTGSAVDAQLQQLTVGGDRVVTLTSEQGTLQVTVVSSAPYPVRAVLTLTSDKLLFPNGTTQWSAAITLLPAVSGTAHTNVVPVPVRTRASGVFTVDIAMHAPPPSYRLELAAGEVSVRSTATSVVGIVLSVGALAVLAVWWVRTSLRRRRQRREEPAPDAPVVPEPG